MSQPDGRGDTLLQDYLRRNERLQRWAWISVGVPLALFVTLCVLTVLKAKEYARLSHESTELKAQIQSQEIELEKQKRQIAVQQLAINIVKEQSPGVRPKVVIYRSLIAGRVDDALRELGYTVELRSDQANPSLAGKPVDTLSYGCAVSNEDIRTVATALAKADLPIRRIVPAEKKKDPNLIQLVSSKQTASGADPLSMSGISGWSRTGKPCQTISPAPTKVGGDTKL
jgi:hypothetical protein